MTFALGIGGNGSLTQAGPGTLTLSGTNSYTGGTTIANGVLALGSNAALPFAGLTFGAAGTSGTLDMAGYNCRTSPVWPSRPARSAMR